MPIDYKNYPPDWKSRIRPEALERANHCCETCGVPNYARGFRDINGEFYTASDIENHGWEHIKVDYDFKVIKIVLTISHQDHNVTNNEPSNLKALCQRCHLMHDREHHTKIRRANRLKHKLKRQMAFETLLDI